MIEIVPMAYRVVHDITPDTSHPSSSLPPPASQSAETPAVGGSIGGGSVGGAAGVKATGTGRIGEVGKSDLAGIKRKLDEEEEREAVFWRLEALGYRVGQGLVERYFPHNPLKGLIPPFHDEYLLTLTHSFSLSRPRFTDTLDVIKFLCKDLWMLVFRKQIDNLKTNHRGVYVLTDNSFRPFSRMSTEPGGNAVARAEPVRSLYLFQSRFQLGWLGYHDILIPRSSSSG